MPSLTQLRYILAVHREGHFGRAARACHISQPTLSTQIQKAEESLGLTIFVRDRKPVTATEQGYALIEQAQVVVAAHERLLRLAKARFQKVAGDLSLGVIPTLAPYCIPWFLSKFAKAYPLVNLNIVERTTEEIIKGLDRQQLDLGLLAIPLGENKLREHSLFHDPFYLYAHPSEPVLEQPQIAAKDLDPEKLWLLQDGHCVRNQTLSYCDLRGGSANLSSVRFEAGSFETLRHLIDASQGYTLIPETYARLLPKAIRRGRVRALADPVPVRQIGLVRLKSSWKLDMVQALERTLLSTVPRALKQHHASIEVLPVREAR